MPGWFGSFVSFVATESRGTLSAMKRWQAILLNLGLAVAGAFVPAIKNQTAQAAAGALVAGAVAAVTSKTSTSNPDGTAAQSPWIPPVK